MLLPVVFPDFISILPLNTLKQLINIWGSMSNNYLLNAHSFQLKWNFTGAARGIWGQNWEGRRLVDKFSEEVREV